MSRSSGPSPDMVRAAKEIAATPVGTDQPEQWLSLLRRVVPFDAAWLGLFDDHLQRYTELGTIGYPDRIRHYFGTQAVTDQADLAGLSSSPVPVRGQDLPAPMEEYPIWGDYYLPAGFREGMAVGLFTPDNRHLGLIVINTDDANHPTVAERQMLRSLAPRVAHTVDPLRSLSVLARVVHDALAGVVLARVGDPLPLSGLPDHPLLAPGSELLAAARQEITGAAGCVTFLWPVAPARAPMGGAAGPDWAARDGLFRVTVLSCELPVTSLAGVVVLSPLPGGRCLLNRRELVLVGLLLDGWTDARIAVGLDLPLSTVTETLARVMHVLGASERHVALLRAARRGWYIPCRPGRAPLG